MSGALDWSRTLVLLDQIISIGRELYDRGMQTSRSGNVSARDEDRFLITKTGTNLGRLEHDDLIAVEVSETVPIPSSASCETPVHRAIYNATSAHAVVHAHPPYAIALAQASLERGIRPFHNEGLAGLGWIPVIDTSVPGHDVGENPNGIAEQLREWCCVLIRGHGAFTIGRDPDEALYKMLLLEHTCKMICIFESLRSSQGPAAAKYAIGL